MSPRFSAIMPILGLAAVFIPWGCSDDVAPGNSLSDPAVLPVVTFTLPGNGSQGPYALYDPGAEHGSMPNFVVRFNKLIRKSSIGYWSVRASGFDRPVTVLLDVDYYRDYWPKAHGRISQSDARLYDDLLAFEILDSGASYSRAVYDVGQLVTISLDSTVEDINGNRLQPYSFSYEPEPRFRVASSYPKDGTTDVGLYGNITVSFNTRCAADILTYLGISPDLQGRWRFNAYSYDSASAYFTPRNPLPFGAPFVLAVDPAAHDRYGHALDQAYTANFVTRTFRVISAYPQGISASLIPQIQLWLTGNLDTGTVRTAFSIAPSVEGQLTVPGYASYIAFLPSLGLAPSTRYTVFLSTSLRERGGAAFDGPFSFTFTSDPFRVISTSPGEYGGVSTDITLYVYSNARIDGATAAGAFTISPSVGGVVGTTGEDQLYFNPTTLLDANTVYTVTIGSSLRTKTGHNLLQPYTWSFTTRE